MKIKSFVTVIVMLLFSSVGIADHRVCIDGLLYEVYYTLDASSDVAEKHVELIWDKDGVCRGKGRV